MGSLSGADRKTGRIRRLMDRFQASEEQPELRSDLVRAEAVGGCTPIGSCSDRQVVKVTGTLRTVTLRARAGVPALEAELFDGSASLFVVWLGRRSIAGVEPGRTMIATGRVAVNHGRPVLFNPKYELRPLGQE